MYRVNSVSKILLSFSICLLSFYSIFAQIPQYYGSINLDLRGRELMEELSWLITTTHTKELTFTPGVWTALKAADLDPDDTTRVLLIYGYDDVDNQVINDRTREVDKNCTQSDCSGLWNREHVVARSQTVPAMGTTGAGADVHNLRAIDSDMNNRRSNRKFASGQGIPSYVVAGGNFFPGDEWRGDVARILMYMYLRYKERALPEFAASGSSSFDPEGKMIDILLIWNKEDPVSLYEINRNNIFQEMQGNRNPFIDNPYLASLIWGGPEADNDWEISSTSDKLTVNIKIYPNPADEMITVSGLYNDVFDYQIFGLTGNLVVNGKSNSTIQISALKPGLYILKIDDTSTTSFHRFFKI